MFHEKKGNKFAILSFPDDMENALKIGFEKMLKKLRLTFERGRLDRSGSCAIVIFLLWQFAICR